VDEPAAAADRIVKVFTTEQPRPHADPAER
jgi:hypothetical protein